MEFEDRVKSSFEKVREDIKLLQEELFVLKREIESLRIELKDTIKPNFMNRSSIGNGGVPANQQTDKPSFNTPSFPVDDNSSELSSRFSENPADIPTHLQQIGQKVQQMHSKLFPTPKITPEIVREILENEAAKRQSFKEKDEKDPLTGLTEVMNTLKSDLKRKFRSLTKQEFYIFSVLYTVEKSQDSVTYSDLAAKTGLTGSSIRDYIQRIIKKGIPIAKDKVNNKVTVLKVPPELRNLATLDNLMRIRNDLKDESLESFSKK